MRSLDLQYYFGSASLYLAKEVAAPLSLSPENLSPEGKHSVNRRDAKPPGPALSDCEGLPPLKEVLPPSAEKGKFC